MKRIFLTLIVCVLGTISMFAQMQFETGTWSEVKAKAKKENKLIFVDTYTSWCGPCKIMVNTIFPLPQVGKFYNENFICYKVDAEKGEGIAIAKEFAVNSFPTYLFIDGTGTLCYRSGGSMPAEKFIGEGEKALELFKSDKKLADWEKEYKSKKNDAQFLKLYIAKRFSLAMDNADLFDECAVACGSDAKVLLDKELLKCTQQHNAFVNAGGPFFNFLVDNCDQVIGLLGISKEMFLYNLPFTTIDYSMRKAAKENNEKLFEQILAGNAKLMNVTGEKGIASEYRIRCFYYGKTNQEENLNKYAADYARALIAKIPECTKKDSESFAKFVGGLAESNELFKGKKPDEIAMMLSFSMNNSAVNLSFALRDLSYQISMLTKDNALKQKALELALLAYKLFDNFSNTEAIAEACYRLGRIDEARFWINYTTERIPAMAGADIRTRVQERASRIR